jgi:tetratricopeptide (TPR) repeat protein
LKKNSAKSARAAAIPGPAAAPLWPRLWPYLFLAALAFGIYANALGNGFVSDDDTQLLRNPMLTDWREIPQIFQHDAWAFSWHGTSNYYRPLQMVLYLAMYYAFGFNAFIFHLAMLLIHVANTLLVYHLGQKWLRGPHTALVAGILFAVHPIHNEAVVWIAVLPDILLTLIVLVCLILFLRWDAAPRRRQIAALAVLFFLALITKEPGAMLAPLLAGYEFLYLGRALWPVAPRGQRRTLWDNWALYASLMAAFGVYAVMRIHALGAMAPAQGVHTELHGMALTLSIIVTLGQYLGKLMAPTHLNYFYVFQATTSVTPAVVVSLAAELGMLAAILLLRDRPSAGLGAATDGRRGNAPLISYALFFILTPLAPALNINGVGEDVFTERYLYLPSVGFVIVAALAWEWLAARQQKLAWAVVAILVAASARILLPRNLDWHDDDRLTRVSLEESPNSATLNAAAGWIHFQRGEYDAAIEKFRVAVERKPGSAEYHNNLGNAYAQQGRYQDALVELRKAAELDPKAAEVHRNIGTILRALGDISGGLAERQKALQLDPNRGRAYIMEAVALIGEKDYSRAIDLLRQAIAANPRSVDAYLQLGVAYNGAAEYEDALGAFHKAIDLEPRHPSAYLAHYNLGVAYWRLNALDAAAGEFLKSLQMKPDFAAAQEALSRLPNTIQPRQAP